MALLTGKELADELGVYVNTVMRNFREKRIPGERMDRLVRFDLKAVRKAMQENAHAPRKRTQAVEGRAGRRQPNARAKKPPSW
jgi:excisionase family DNA binding protein